MPSGGHSQPKITRAIFGLSEHDLPAAGIDHVAVWPVIESVPGRFGSTTISNVRRHLAWRSMSRHAVSIVDLELRNAPQRAAKRIQKNRSKAGLTPAVAR